MWDVLAAATLDDLAPFAGYALLLLCGLLALFGRVDFTPDGPPPRPMLPPSDKEL
jgi:hypothetical protein